MCIALAIGGAAVLTAGAGVYEANKAAGAQQNAANQAQQTQSSQFAQTNANQAPFRQAGVTADQQLAGYYGLPGSTPVDPSKTIAGLPGYQFQMQQGTQAIDRSQAANGLLNSGSTGKALAQYGQGLAQNYSQQYVGGLQNLANLGEGATQSTAAAGAGAANQISSAQIYSGQAQAQGDINSYNAISSGLNQGIGLYGLYQGQQQQKYNNLQPYNPTAQYINPSGGYGSGSPQALTSSVPYATGLN